MKQNPEGGSVLRRVRRWCRVEHVLVVSGLALLPWLVVLAAELPTTAVASNWRTVWIGLDAAEAVALITTGLLAVRGHRLHPLTATAAATLLVVDAWFDTVTAAPGADQVSAAAMALGAELPLAVVCAVLAARGHARPTETCPAGTRPAGTRPAGTRPTDARPTDARLAGTRPTDTRLAR
ncbi:hypothetical protein ACFZC6_40415 [Streptomyces ossamyceticus]|uniref:hypothetical protein n=1 Tax=Streptomyces ossamyceticus TaxID=249581 RepID=UPI0036EF7D1C